MKSITISDEAHEWLVNLKKRVKRTNGFSPSFAECIDEMKNTVSKKSLKLFAGVEQTKVYISKVSRDQYEISPPCAKALRKIGFMEHAGMMYYRKDDVVLMVIRKTHTTYLIKRTDTGVIYHGPIRKDKLIRLMKLQMRKM